MRILPVSPVHELMNFKNHREEEQKKKKKKNKYSQVGQSFKLLNQLDNVIVVVEENDGLKSLNLNHHIAFLNRRYRNTIKKVNKSEKEILNDIIKGDR